ncbi:TPA: tail fiber assembly protein [Citrobacter freundii]|nr:tail fiber assembly protein [Citrobacter farmeri]HAT2284184.1 tail fiber assembly protein [Citrobacter freundii]HAT2348177.1 tail fiber assembly protein [Citrobacter freundii]HAT2429767.1 tail fiber assembly protein [Citrobacter freundii]HAT2501305.1 tail fiber assembly protein [Citrobacter freundii]
MFLFSRSTLAFYPESEIEAYEAAGTLPNDVIEVSDEVRNEYIFTQPEGKKLGVNSKGYPAWIDVPPPTLDELIANAEQERQRLLDYADAVMLDWRTELMLGEIGEDNREKLSAWLAYKNDVKSVDVTTDPEHVSWPVPPEA